MSLKTIKDCRDGDCISCRAISYARRWPGLTTGELLDALGIETGRRNTVDKALSRAVKHGHLRREGTRCKDSTYHPTESAWEKGQRSEYRQQRSPWRKAPIIRELRAQGLKQREIAARVGTHQSTVSQILRRVA